MNLSPEITAHAKLIPTKDLSKDLECLDTLIRHSQIYFDFCYSRYLQLSDHPETISALKLLVESMSNHDQYIPLLEIVLSHLDPESASSFIMRIFTNPEKTNFVASSIFVLPEFYNLKLPLLKKLFDIIPSGDLISPIIHIRDNLLFRCITSGSPHSLGLSCLSRIPSKLSDQFLQEFISISSFLIQNGCKDSKLCSIIIDTILTCEEFSPLIDILRFSQLKVPKLFVDWLKQKGFIFPEFSRKIKNQPSTRSAFLRASIINNNSKEETIYEMTDRVYEASLSELPPLLRSQMLQPFVDKLNGPRLCRTAVTEKDEDSFDEIRRRLYKETDPKMVHDYLIAISDPLPIMGPFKFTLLAAASMRDPQYSDNFCSEFSRLSAETPVDVLVVASYALENVASRFPDTVIKLFPLLRKILNKCLDKRVRTSLLNSIAYAVGSDLLDPEFIWREYHSIRTITEEGLFYENIIHHCIIGLNDPDDSETAVFLLHKLLHEDKLAVLSGLWRFPMEKLSKFSSLLPELSGTQPILSVKTDLLPQYVEEELHKNMTTQRMMQLATAYVIFFDVFSSIYSIVIDNKEKQEQLNKKSNKISQWASILVKTGSCLYNMEVETEFLDAIFTLFYASIDEKDRFACAFSLALFLNYRLMIPEERFIKLIRYHSQEDESKLVRVISLFACSLCPPPPDPSVFVDSIIKRGKNHNCAEDLIGIGYCISSWFSYLKPYLERSSTLINDLNYLWPFIADVDIFMMKKPRIKENDEIGLAQFLYMQRSNPAFDQLVNDFITQGLTTDNLTVAVCGYVPCIAFNINEYCPDERQRKIINCVKANDEFNFINQLLTRTRLSHSPKQDFMNISKTRTLVERLKADWSKMDEEEAQMIIHSLSKNQIGEIVSHVNEGYALFTAIFYKSLDDIARLLCAHRWSSEMYERVKKAYSSQEDLSQIISKMCELINLSNSQSGTKSNSVDCSVNEKLTRIADVLAFYRFGELLNEQNSLEVLPMLLSSVDPMDMTIAQAGKCVPDFTHCLMLKNPEFFELNEDEGFGLFQ